MRWLALFGLVCWGFATVRFVLRDRDQRRRQPWAVETSPLLADWRFLVPFGAIWWVLVALFILLFLKGL